MRSNRNISPRQDGTLKSAEIFNFWQSQSVDNQCLFFCQNVTSFTGKEKDSETGFYYFGARYYDPVLSGLFISVDPMADKYPSLSPYAYCACNPINLVDPDGEENVIYIVNIQGKNSSIDINKLITEVNNRFEKLGLETRAMLAPDGKSFNPEYMDKTDSYAVIGNFFDVKDFISTKDDSKAITGWNGGTYNPERSENNNTRKGNYIAVDASGLSSIANLLGFDKTEMAALTILHGAGHNAGFNHSDDIISSRRFGQDKENAAIMLSGPALKGQRDNGLDNIMHPDHNKKYIERMQTVFGSKKAHSNYENKKNAKQHSYLVY